MLILDPALKELGMRLSKLEVRGEAKLGEARKGIPPFRVLARSLPRRTRFRDSIFTNIART